MSESFAVVPADINECETTNDCHALSDCTNNEGSYYCTCQEGFVSVGVVEGTECTGKYL